ncbi:hypothetical protein ACH5BK_12235 [Arcobacter sp. YIC-80]|uniref:hypothetical protein n=1 Tax=Arcobacter sp. YIC-80 TaxID=3376683 RepID=UPI00384D5468
MIITLFVWGKVYEFPQEVLVIYEQIRLKNDEVFKLLYLGTWEVQEKWKTFKIKGWSEIYLNLAYFSVRLWKNILNDLEITVDLDSILQALASAYTSLNVFI